MGEKLRFHAVRVADAVGARVCQSLGILQTGKLTLIHAIWFQSVRPRATPRGNLVRSCDIISRIDISQNPRLPSTMLSSTIDHRTLQGLEGPHNTKISSGDGYIRHLYGPSEN